MNSETFVDSSINFPDFHSEIPIKPTSNHACKQHLKRKVLLKQLSYINFAKNSCRKNSSREY